MDPIDEYLLSKEAAGTYGVGEMASGAYRGAKQVGQGALGGKLREGFQSGLSSAAEAVGKHAPAVAAGAALLGVGVMVAKLRGAAQKKEQFEAMLDAHPQLREYHAQDPKLFNQAYDSLHSFVPAYAADPLIAGHVMSRMLEAGPTQAGVILTQLVKPPDAPGGGGGWSADVPMGPLRFRAGL
jgi:hypothetical protein